MKCRVRHILIFLQLAQLTTCDTDLSTISARKRVENLFSDWNDFTSTQMQFDEAAVMAWLPAYIDKYYADDVVDQVMGVPSFSGMTLQGKAVVIEGTTGFLQAVPDMRLRLVDIVEQGTKVFVEYTILGHDQGSLIAVDSSVVYVFDERGLIAHQRYYFDLHGFKNTHAATEEVQGVLTPAQQVQAMYDDWNAFTRSRSEGFDKYKSIAFLDSFFDKYYGPQARVTLFTTPFSDSLLSTGKDQVIEHNLGMLRMMPSAERTMVSAVQDSKKVFVELLLTGRVPGGEGLEAEEGLGGLLEAPASTVYTFDDWGRVVEEKTYMDVHGWQAALQAGSTLHSDL